jgi:hypothetical protein
MLEVECKKCRRVFDCDREFPNRIGAVPSSSPENRATGRLLGECPQCYEPCQGEVKPPIEPQRRRDTEGE